MQLDQYGRSIGNTKTLAGMQEEIAIRKLQAAQAKALNLVTRFNQDPRLLTDDEAGQAVLAAQALGYNVSRGKEKDKANVFDISKAIGLGALDSILFGLIKNEAYESRRTKNYARTGRLLGLVGSIAMGAVSGPGIISGLSKAAGALKAPAIVGKAAKLAYSMTPVGIGSTLRTAPSAISAIKAANGVAELGTLAKLTNITKEASRFIPSAIGANIALQGVGGRTSNNPEDVYGGMLPPLQ